MSNNSIHEAAIEILCANRPALHTKRFRKELKTFLANVLEDFDLKEAHECIHSSKFIPDAFQLISEPPTVIIYEVEDSSKISANKLRDIAQLFWYLDDEDIDFQLFVTDRYGLSERKIPLLQFSLALA